MEKSKFEIEVNTNSGQNGLSETNFTIDLKRTVFSTKSAIAISISTILEESRPKDHEPYAVFLEKSKFEIEMNPNSGQNGLSEQSSQSI